MRTLGQTPEDEQIPLQGRSTSPRLVWEVVTHSHMMESPLHRSNPQQGRHASTPKRRVMASLASLRPWRLKPCGCNTSQTSTSWGVFRVIWHPVELSDGRSTGFEGVLPLGDPYYIYIWDRGTILLEGRQVSIAVLAWPKKAPFCDGVVSASKVILQTLQI